MYFPEHASASKQYMTIYRQTTACYEDSGKQSVHRAEDLSVLHSANSFPRLIEEAAVVMWLAKDA